MSSVKVLMGGVDITSQVVSHGGTPAAYTINIPKVTANVQVVATNVADVLTARYNTTNCTITPMDNEIAADATKVWYITPDTNCYFTGNWCDISGIVAGSATFEEYGNGYKVTVKTKKASETGEVVVTATATAKHLVTMKFFGTGYTYSVTPASDSANFTFSNNKVIFPADPSVIQVRAHIVLTPSEGTTISGTTINADGTDITPVGATTDFTIPLTSTTQTVTISTTSTTNLVIKAMDVTDIDYYYSVSPSLPLSYATTPTEDIVLTFTLVHSAYYWKGWTESGRTIQVQIYAKINGISKKEWTTYYSSTLARITIPAGQLTSDVTICYYLARS